MVKYATQIYDVIVAKNRSAYELSIPKYNNLRNPSEIGKV